MRLINYNTNLTQLSLDLKLYTVGVGHEDVMYYRGKKRNVKEKNI